MWILLLWGPALTITLSALPTLMCFLVLVPIMGIVPQEVGTVGEE
jgi:hypothetical protein